MEPDGWVKDPRKLLYFDVVCHKCQKSVDHATPIMNHTECVDSDGELPVYLVKGNYIENRR